MSQLPPGTPGLGVGSDPSWPGFQASGPLIPHGGREEQSHMLGPGCRAGFCGQQASGVLEGPHCSGRPQPGRGLVQRQCLAPEKEKGSTELQEKAGAREAPLELGGQTANSPSGEGSPGLHPEGASQTLGQPPAPS